MQLDATGVDLLVRSIEGQPQVSLAHGLLVLRDWRVSLSVAMHSVGQADANMTGVVAIGGSTGFSANISGTIDTEAETASFVTTSSGGWAPFPSALPQLVSPAFVEEMTIGGEALISYH
eukprot:3727796-Prymnesium_polylepis.1